MTLQQKRVKISFYLILWYILVIKMVYTIRTILSFAINVYKLPKISKITKH